MSPMDIGIMGFISLIYIYMKFLIIWRFFRLWALYDGIDTVENMNRCVVNNFTFTGFWRAWHSSMNIFVVRYLYRPLGGRKSQLWSIWVIFTFIGLWHDLWWRWVAWAWLNCIFFSAELVVMKVFDAKFKWMYDKWYFKYLVAFAGHFDIWFLIVANTAILHGFDWTPKFLAQLLLQPGGLGVLIFCFFFFNCGILIQLKIRENERLYGSGKRY
eukprot:GEZU01025929.1.p1 GENE.GEZU01025929.1~~GEZU01025929.1.p1  ORF type:complete len:245 (+),score=38.10 GEZU01025929.1:96-737(+)